MYSSVTRFRHSYVSKALVDPGRIRAEHARPVVGPDGAAGGVAREAADPADAGTTKGPPGYSVATQD